MKILLVHPGPAFSVADVYLGWLKGLRQCGATVAEYNLGDRISFYNLARIEYDGKLRDAFSNEDAVRLAAAGLEGACFRWWPDIVMVVSAFFVPPETYDVIGGRGMGRVMLHTESPYEDDVQIARAARADLNLINDPTNIDKFREVAPTLYAPHAYDPDVHMPRPVDPSKALDFFFCGTGFDSRREFFEACDFDGVDAKFGGNWQSTDPETFMRRQLVHDSKLCLDNDETQRWYTSTKASVNLYRKEAQRPELSEGWAMGPREVELAASGTFFLRDHRGEGDEVFPMLPTFEGPDDFCDQLKWWLAHDQERAAVSAKARAAIQDRTFAANAAVMLETLGF